MNPDQAELLRRVALKDKQALDRVMASDNDALPTLDARCAALVRIAALLSVDSDPSTFEWAVDTGIAAGLDDDAIFDALLVIAPVIGVARLTSTLPRLMSALDLDIVED
jgi:alkylhydroperoxidase/carboxymuconolactone decarboxylase family protein YurZ